MSSDSLKCFLFPQHLSTLHLLYSEGRSQIYHKSQNWDYYPYWGWGWYWKSTKESTYWGYPGYGWYYPYSPTYITSYTTGTIAWNLFDPDLVDDAQEQINVGWIGVVNGVVGSSTSTTQSRITSGIDQAFNEW